MTTPDAVTTDPESISRAVDVEILMLEEDAIGAPEIYIVDEVVAFVPAVVVPTVYALKTDP